MHPLIDPNGYYEPSNDAKQAWLRTRKSSMSYGSISLPGLYVTSKYDDDKRGFRFALLGEAIGVIAIIWAAGTFNIMVFAMFVAGILLDIIFSLSSHLFTGKICILKNKKTIQKYYAKRLKELVERDAKPKDARKAKSEGHDILAQQKQFDIYWRIGIHIFFQLLIVILAMLKIFIFHEIENNVTLVTIAIVIVYALVAYLHIKHTAFFFAEHKFRMMIEKEKAKLGLELAQHPHLRGNLESGSIFKQFSVEEINDYIGSDSLKTDVQSNKHSFIFSQDETTYKFKTWGILQDDDLYKLAVNEQSSTAAHELVGIGGLLAQIQILSAAPAYEALLRRNVNINNQS